MTSRACAMRVSVLAFGLSLVACGGRFDLPGRATDEWQRSYPLADGGQLRISNTNGIVEIEGVTGSTVDVRAERIAHASTDAAARDLLSHIVIKEDAAPARLSLESEQTSSLMGVAYEVHYHVRAPKDAVVRATTTNGLVLLTGLAGKTTASTTNGGIRAEALAGGFTAASTNGRVDLEIAALGGDVDVRTTNGSVSLTLPVNAAADLNASVTNGAIIVAGLPFDALDQSRRHFSARINGGGTPVTVRTTNGAIRIGAP